MTSSPPPSRWVALLRGVNVGGGNRIAMGELRDSIELLGFANVRSYIQSGNVVFDAAGQSAGDERTVVELIATALRERHGLDVPIVVRPASDLVRIAAAHPDAETGIDPKLLHIWFLDRAPAADVVADFDLSPFAPDGWTIAGREAYVRHPNGSGRSRLTIEVAERAFGVRATARNLTTVRALAEMAT